MNITAGFVYLVVSEGGPGAPLLDEIVVPLDGSRVSERAVPIAADLAVRVGGGLRLLTTKADVGEHSPSFYLDTVAATVADVVEVATDVVLDAEPAGSILDAMHRGQVGVCMTTHARGRLLGALHESIAETIVAARSGPVFLIGPSCTSSRLGDGPVLVGLDGTADATSRTRSLIPLLAAIADSLTAVTIVPGPYGKSADNPYSGLKKSMQPVLDEALQQGLQASHHVSFATDVHRGLIHEISVSQPSLVVLAAHQHTTMQRLRNGSTTSAIVHDSPVPVLVT
jgi:nucleotide-binding universal stress UspA family protein